MFFKVPKFQLLAQTYIFAQSANFDENFDIFTQISICGKQFLFRTQILIFHNIICTILFAQYYLHNIVCTLLFEQYCLHTIV
mgnify:CR=1 FL=1